jgi:hypothetical protein
MFYGVPANYATLSGHAMSASVPVLEGTVQKFVQGHTTGFVAAPFLLKTPPLF